MAQGPYKYRAFVSYSQSDKTTARRLQKWLEAYRAPKAMGGAKIGMVFRDEEDLSGAPDLGEALKANIDAAEALIVLCSPKAAQSRWVEREIEHFRATGRGKQIFAVILAGAPNSGDAATECFPPSFRAEDGAEPLAVNLAADGRERAFTRLAAGLLGVGFDALWQRERRRRRSKVLSAAGAFILGSCAILGLFFRDSLKTELMRINYFSHPLTVSELRMREPRSVFSDCQNKIEVCPSMVVVPDGQYWMGASDDDVSPDSDELPRRLIDVGRFAAATTEVTFDHWKACVDGGGCKSQPVPGDANWGRGAQPVINVSWNDAQEYVTWLSEMTGGRYRLLTEAEWEYAARAGSQTTYSFGSADQTSMLDQYGWHFGNSNRSRAAATKLANRFGLHDMHGNVAEWVEDCFASYEGSAPRSIAFVPPSEDCNNRSVRGGSFFSLKPRFLSSSYRFGNDRTYRNKELGFRVARDISGQLPIVLEITEKANSALTPASSSRWVLTLFNVDDWMSCSLNGFSVADLERYGEDPGYKEIGVDLLIKPGTNRLDCEAEDRVIGEVPCWEYNYKLTNGGAIVAAAGEKRCDREAPAQPKPPVCFFNSASTSVDCDFRLPFRE